MAEVLFLPLSYLKTRQQQQQRFGPQFIVPITYSDVAGRKATPKDLWRAMNAVGGSQAVVTLSMILNSVEKFQHDRQLQSALVEKFLRPEYRKLPERAPGEKRPDYEDIFNPLGALFALKLLLGAAPFPGRDQPAEEADQFAIGDLMLLANEFVLVSTLTAETMTDANLAADFLPVWDLTNEGRIVYEMGRMYRMIAVHLAGLDPKVSRVMRQLGVGLSGITFGGIPLEGYIFAVFVLWARIQNIISPEFLRNPGIGIFDSLDLLKKSSFPPGAFQHFLDDSSFDSDALRAKLSGQDTGWDEGMVSELLTISTFRSDFLAFRERPILRLENRRYLVLCGHFLADLLSIGIVFQIRSVLPAGKGALLMSLFGRLFELYASELLESFYPPLSGFLQIDVGYADGQLDALLDFGEYVVLLEFKFFLLNHEIKHSRKTGELEKSLREKLVENERGERKAARQLAHAAQAVLDGTISTARTGKPIYPVVVIYESGLQCPGANTVVNRYFQEHRALLTRPDLIRPMTVMSVAELEDLLPQVGAGSTTWRDVLDARLIRDDDVMFISVHQALYDLMKKHGKVWLNNGFLRRVSDEMVERMRAYFPEPESSAPQTEPAQGTQAG